jgi:hypothetical protein
MQDVNQPDQMLNRAVAYLESQECEVPRTYLAPPNAEEHINPTALLTPYGRAVWHITAHNKDGRVLTFVLYADESKLYWLKNLKLSYVIDLAHWQMPDATEAN